jgi:phosphoglucomutase
MHPEPDFSYIPELIRLNSTLKYDLVSAWDSDVDRRLDGGRGFFIESADEFALFAKYSSLINIEKLFPEKIYFCRSAVTAEQIDRMEDFLIKKFSSQKVKTVETPTGFKWIAELGNWGVEESNGVGNPYLREKDGIFSTVFLLKIILETGKTVKELMEEIWKDFGRVYFTRGEVSGASLKARDILTEILNSSSSSVGKKFGSLILEQAGSWDYVHPDTGNIASKDVAWIFNFSEGNSIKARFSGTGSGGYTLRIYCSKYDRKYDMQKSSITKPMKEAFDDFLIKNEFNGKSKKYTDEDQPEIY